MSKFTTRFIQKHCTGLTCESPSLTQQHFKDDTDINVLVKRYVNQGQPLPTSNNFIFGELKPTSLLEAKEMVENAREAFMSFPAEIRAKFDNDPVKMCEFALNESNYDESVKLGLLPARSVEQVEDLCDANSSPSPNHLSLTGEGDTTEIKKQVETTSSIES